MNENIVCYAAVTGPGYNQTYTAVSEAAGRVAPMSHACTNACVCARVSTRTTP